MGRNFKLELAPKVSVHWFLLELLQKEGSVKGRNGFIEADVVDGAGILPILISFGLFSGPAKKATSKGGNNIPKEEEEAASERDVFISFFERQDELDEG